MRQWIADYGGFAAAVVAALVALWTRYDVRRSTAEEWQRNARLTRYAEFLSAAIALRRETVWHYAEPDTEVLGPKPETVDYPSAEVRFTGAITDVLLLGPWDVSNAARRVQFSLWHYRNQLDVDPFRYGQGITQAAINDFVLAAQTALGIEADTYSALSYDDWKESVDPS